VYYVLTSLKEGAPPQKNHAGVIHPPLVFPQHQIILLQYAAGKSFVDNTSSPSSKKKDNTHEKKKTPI